MTKIPYNRYRCNVGLCTRVLITVCVVIPVATNNRLFEFLRIFSLGQIIE